MARKRGLSTRAVQLLSRWALRELDVERLALHTHPENVASQHVAERAGFVREGTLRSFDTRAHRIREVVSFSLVLSDLA